ncbi:MULTISPECIES: hypothetical protein [Galbibacter]|uniref:Outer membrane protein beta-barrel domain-containing protein n=1 Tax=Galbibacter pacificus TaxID=2996052 RepID=A0ABT6FVI2_9FLAO|nr:hypothetical protein [Galbibacter pacificus]MDG3583801.1 hypothetical protein [Galbibacter pacificus]MDG3587281.1 hypothetical protein [Galbibacter pacificus]
MKKQKAIPLKRFPLFIFLFLSFSVLAQEAANTAGEQNSNETETFKHHKPAIFTGYSWVPQGRNENTGEKETIFVPSIGFSYEYWFSEKWAIGTYNDVEIVKYEVERDDEDIDLKRENALSLSLAAVYEVLPKWTLIAGGGLDIDKNETLPILHLATEYVILEKNATELSVSLSYNNKEYYDTFSIGLVLGKKL